MRRRGWLIGFGIIAIIVALLLRRMDPIEVCCIQLPVRKEASTDAEAEKERAEAEALQTAVARRSDGSFFHDLATWRLLVKARNYGTYVYGPDDRMDLLAEPIQASQEAIEANIKATALIVNKDAVLAAGTTTRWRLNVDRLTGYGFCACERFSDQYTAMRGAPCTGFLLDATHVITASHCVEDVQYLALKRFIFGFQIRADGADPRDLDDSQIYSATQVVYRSNPCDVRDPDVAIVLLDRAVPIQPSIRATETPRYRDPVYLIGYPLGLPAKYAPGARVRENKPSKAYFVANTDGYKGNSGSPVFNSVNEVVGVQVRGVVSIAQPCGCWTSTWCPNNGCRGEHITRISEVPAVPPTTPTPFETALCEGKALNPRIPTSYERWLAKRYPMDRIR